MTLRYGLVDAWGLDRFRKMSKKSFTFDNGRSEHQAAVSRIDKFMVSHGIEERGGEWSPRLLSGSSRTTRR